MRIFTVPIIDPFRVIASHVQCPVLAGTGRVFSDRRNVSIPVIHTYIFPAQARFHIGKIHQITRWRLISSGIHALICTACRFFPFRLRRQAATHPGAIGRRLLPRDIHNGVRTRSGRHETGIHRIGQLVLVDPKSIQLHNRTGFSSGSPVILPMLKAPFGTYSITIPSFARTHMEPISPSGVMVGGGVSLGRGVSLGCRVLLGIGVCVGGREVSVRSIGSAPAHAAGSRSSTASRWYNKKCDLPFIHCVPFLNT